MSLTATRNTKTRSAIAARYNAAEAQQDIVDYLDGCYEAPENIWHVDMTWLEGYEALSTNEDRQAYLKGYSTLARLMAKEYARRGWMPYDGNDQPRVALTLQDVLSRALAQRRVLRWMRQNEALCREIGTWEHRPFPESLTSLGVDGAKSAQRFAEFYRTVHKPERVWLSGCQVDQVRAADIALTPNYNRLPAWVRQGLMNAPHSAKIGGDRIGDIWRLPACVKAWKWAPLPKRIAEKVGKCSPRFRMLAAIAWAGCGDEVATFWEHLDWLQRASLMEVVHYALKGDEGYPVIQWGRARWAAFLTGSLGLPWGLIELPKEVTAAAITEAITTYGNPRQACLALFGVAGKATERLFSQATKESWQWASALAHGNADAVQKILSMPTLIEWQPEAVDFLKSLPMVSRLRMLQATEFRYRGEVCPISADHVRDTGYLWSNIQSKPELGRVRCWFSVHEQLAAAFVKELPDEALSIPAGWERIDGLCSVNGSWELEFPKRVATLKYWGQTLRNCVGGYGPAIKSGRSVIFTVRQQGQLTHCVEFSGGYCNQFYRSGNGSPDYEIKESVIAALEQAGLA